MSGNRLPDEKLIRENSDRPSRVLRVPEPKEKQEFARHSRLRRTSSISRFVVAAGLEALGDSRAEAVRNDEFRLGIIVVFATGCVTYTRRFFEELLDDPALASPILFPETVFNAPASHLAAILGSTGINYTLLGDSAEFLSGVNLASDWLITRQCDGCLVIGAEEIDWLISESLQLFTPEVILAEGAGALYLERGERSEPSCVQISQITDPILYTNAEDRSLAPSKMREQLELDPSSENKTVLLDGLKGSNGLDLAENVAWGNWSGPRLSIRMLLGESPGASTAWQCVTAASLLCQKHEHCDSALVSAVGLNQQCIAAKFSAQSSSS